MIIKYKKRPLNVNLIIGVAWLIFSLAFYFISPENKWMPIGYAGIGIAFLLLYFHMKHWQYGLITTNFVKLNNAFKKQLPLSEVVEIKEFAGDIIFKSVTRDVTFDTKIIEEKSLVEFRALIEDIKMSRNL